MIVRNRKPMFLAIACLLFLMNGAYSAIITVDNNYPKVGDYATLQEAHDGANNGDTLYVFPSLANYTAITLQKSLCIIGAGYHSQLSGIRPTLVEGTFEFTPLSSGSTLTSFGGIFNIIIDGDNVTIKRNKFNTSYNSPSPIVVKEGHSGTVIMQNIFSISLIYTFIINIQSNNEAFISNNILKNYYPGSGGYHGIRAIHTSNTTILINNVFYTTELALELGSSNAIAYNNIFFSGYITGNQLGFHNNLISPDIDSVFENYLEDNYQLKADSPAKGTGYKGSDMGIYGGDFPFVDGGIPAIPSIYYLDVPLTGTKQDGINVSIKVKSNN